MWMMLHRPLTTSSTWKINEWMRSCVSPQTNSYANMQTLGVDTYKTGGCICALPSPPFAEPTIMRMNPYFLPFHTLFKSHTR